MKNIFLMLCAIFLSNLLFSQGFKSIPIINNDIIYIPQEDRIYVTTPASPLTGNSLCVINPYLGEIEQCYFLGKEPNKMAVSDDGQFLYIGLAQESTVLRFNLASKTVDFAINLKESGTPQSRYAEDMEVLPGQPHSVAIALKDSPYGGYNHEGLVIFDDTIPRPNRTKSYNHCNSLAFSPHNGKLYAYQNRSSGFRFIELLIDSAGVSIFQSIGGLVSGFDVEIESQEQFIYSSEGHVVDLTTPSPGLAGIFEIDPYVYFRTAVEAAPDSNVVYFLGYDFNNVYHLLSYDKTNFDFLGQLEINLDFAQGNLKDLINWGTNGKLAFNTPNQIVVFHDCTSSISDSLILDPSFIGGCWGDDFTISASSGYDNYLWSNADTAQSITVNQPGEYYFQVADSTGCLSKPSNAVEIALDHQPFAPQIVGPSDLTICLGEMVALTATKPTRVDSYLWPNGDTTQTIQVSEPGVYSVIGLTENGCATNPSSSVNVSQSNDSIPPPPEIAIDGEVVFCQGAFTTLSAPPGNLFYIWSNGKTSQSIDVTETGMYSVIVEDFNGCTSVSSDTISITVIPVPQEPTIALEGSYLVSSSEFGNQWFLNNAVLTGDTSQYYLPLENGPYAVRVTLDGCSSGKSDFYNYQKVNTDDVTTNNNFIIAPNPANDFLVVQLINSDLLPNVQFQLYNSSGVMLDTFKANQEAKSITRLSIGHLNPGMYFLLLRDNDNGILSMKKIIKL